MDKYKYLKIDIKIKMSGKIIQNEQKASRGKKNIADVVMSFFLYIIRQVYIKYYILYKNIYLTYMYMHIFYILIYAAYTVYFQEQEKYFHSDAGYNNQDKPTLICQFRTGYIYDVFGRAGTGKSQLCMSLAVECAIKHPKTGRNISTYNFIF